MRILIRSGYICNHSGCEIADILLESEVIKKVGKELKESADLVIFAEGKYVLPGLVDLHCHLRYPGDSDSEDIRSGSLSASKGGYTTVVAMPNTSPVVDNTRIYREIKERIREEAVIEVIQASAITKDLKNEAMAEIGSLYKEGCRIFSNDGGEVENIELLRRAFIYLSQFKDVIYFSHPEIYSLSGDGQINEGPVSTYLGLPGIPYVSESIAVARDIMLANYAGLKIHLLHISTKESLEVVKFFKSLGYNITTEVTPHHLILSEEELYEYDTNKKIKPPLRSEEDRRSLIEGLKNSVIDAIATDHAPHEKKKKEVVFPEAPFGTIGFETTLPALYTYFVKNSILNMSDLVKFLSYNPARILNRTDIGEIKEGKLANLVIFNKEEKWLVTPSSFSSKSSNSAFIGKELYGTVELTIYKGKIVYEKQKSGKV